MTDRELIGIAERESAIVIVGGGVTPGYICFGFLRRPMKIKA